MNPKEQEVAIGELEERVDRLRNLYEQYFLGFEKLEPSVSRKDVDRRFALLRKEQIRNTAMRFRFNVVTQKFNTYAMHWVRICRQIEDGTYKRHVRKAKARFGDGARGGREKDLSIDIDIGDFENEDVDALLAEANAQAEDFARDAADTVPPPAMHALGQDKAAMARQLLLSSAPTPGTSFVASGGREVVDDIERAPASGAFRERAARGAALPPGAKPRILRKRDDTEPPASQPDLGPSSARIPSSPNPPGGAQARPRIAPIGTNAGRAGAAAAHSSGQIPVAAPSSARALAVSAGAQGAGRIPAASPAAPPPQAGASSAGRMPAASPSSPSAPRTPAAPQAGPSSAGRMPVPAPSSVAVPAAPPRQPPAMPSAGRLPPAPAAPPPSDRRLPVPPPGAPSAPAIRPANPRAPSRPGAPAARPAAPPDPGSRPRPREGMPSVSDAGPPSDARPSVRPRAPLPLPSQIARPTKKE